MDNYNLENIFPDIQKIEKRTSHNLSKFLSKSHSLETGGVLDG